MLNIWYYIGTAASYVYVVLPITGLLLLLFPTSALHFRNRFRIFFYLLLTLALLSQFAVFGFVWGMGIKYVERTGFIKTFTDIWPFVMLVFFILIFLFSIYLQSKKIDRTQYQNISPGIAFYAALTITGPLYFILVSLLNKLLAS